MTRCQQCRHFIKTYEDEGWCSNGKYSGFIEVKFNEERCKGEGFVRETELPLTQPSAPEANPHTL
jgi:hypothetical protein